MPVPLRRLPPHPNLEQLRKQAKDLLDEHRANDPAFALHDAQGMLARVYGYESWAKLKAFVDGTSVARLAEAVQAGDVAQARALLHARPELVRMDMAATPRSAGPGARCFRPCPSGPVRGGHAAEPAPGPRRRPEPPPPAGRRWSRPRTP